MTREEEIRARCEAELKNLQRSPLVMISGPRVEKVLGEDIPYMLAENARLRAELEAAKEAIAGLADGGYGICDMCSLYGNNKDTTKCPYGCYHASGIQRSIGTYPDDPCDQFVYASSCAENGGRDG